MTMIIKVLPMARKDGGCDVWTPEEIEHENK